MQICTCVSVGGVAYSLLHFERKFLNSINVFFLKVICDLGTYIYKLIEIPLITL